MYSIVIILELVSNKKKKEKICCLIRFFLLFKLKLSSHHHRQHHLSLLLSFHLVFYSCSTLQFVIVDGTNPKTRWKAHRMGEELMYSLPYGNDIFCPVNAMTIARPNDPIISEGERREWWTPVNGYYHLRTQTIIRIIFLVELFTIKTISLISFVLYIQ